MTEAVLSMFGLHVHAGGAAPKAATAVEEGEAVPQQILGKPFVEVQWEMLHHNPSILYFRALLLQIQVAPAVPHPVIAATQLSAASSPAAAMPYICRTVSKDKGSYRYDCPFFEVNSLKGTELARSLCCYSEWQCMAYCDLAWQNA